MRKGSLLGVSVGNLISSDDLTIAYIGFSIFWPMCHVRIFHSDTGFTYAASHTALIIFATPWTVTHQAPLSMEFSRQEYWSELPCPPPGDLSDPVIDPKTLCLLCWQTGSLSLAPRGKPSYQKVRRKFFRRLCRTDSWSPECLQLLKWIVLGALKWIRSSACLMWKLLEASRVFLTHLTLRLLLKIPSPQY